MNSDDRIEIFIDADRPGPCLFAVTLQLSWFSMTLAARDLSFITGILRFIAETKDNPAFRDIPLEGGLFRCLPKKSADLSPSFVDVSVVMVKDGEYDADYIFRITSGHACSMNLTLTGERLDDFAGDLQEVADSYDLEWEAPCCNISRSAG